MRHQLPGRQQGTAEPRSSGRRVLLCTAFSTRSPLGSRRLRTACSRAPACASAAGPRAAWRRWEGCAGQACGRAAAAAAGSGVMTAAGRSGRSDAHCDHSSTARLTMHCGRRPSGVQPLAPRSRWPRLCLPATQDIDEALRSRRPATAARPAPDKSPAAALPLCLGAAVLQNARGTRSSDHRMLQRAPRPHMGGRHAAPAGRAGAARARTNARLPELPYTHSHAPATSMAPGNRDSSGLSGRQVLASQGGWERRVEERVNGERQRSAKAAEF